MAQEELTGKTQEQLLELRSEYRESPKYRKTGTPFEVSYCLTAIGKQPDDYEGEQRYCVQRVKRLDDGEHCPSCRFHGGRTASDSGLEHLSPVANLKHGMYATDEHLKDAFTEQDQKLYDFVLSWADAYGWPSKEEDPARHDLLEQAAVARVRVARSEKYILDEGEMDRQEVYDENGNLRVITDAHGLSEDIRLKRKLIIDIMKELGITPKEQARQNTEETKASAAETVATLATEAVFGDDEKSFDPDDEIFEED